MQSRVRGLSSILALVGVVVGSALLASATGCDWLPGAPTPRAIATPTPLSTPALTPIVTPSETPLAEVPLEIRSARDALLAFLRQQYPGKAPSETIAWSGRDTTPPGVRGVPTYEFTGDGWRMEVAALAVSPGSALYELGLQSPERGLRWTAKLGAAYELVESNLNLAAEVLLVRDIVLGYVRERYPGQSPPDNLAWIGERTTPAGLVGHESCRFLSVAPGQATLPSHGTVGEWQMTVDYDLVSRAQLVYKVELTHAASAFVWRGQVDAEGAVLEHQ